MVQASALCARSEYGLRGEDHSRGARSDRGEGLGACQDRDYARFCCVECRSCAGDAGDSGARKLGGVAQTLLQRWFPYARASGLEAPGGRPVAESRLTRKYSKGPASTPASEPVSAGRAYVPSRTLRAMTNRRIATGMHARLTTPAVPTGILKWPRSSGWCNRNCMSAANSTKSASEYRTTSATTSSPNGASAKIE